MVQFGYLLFLGSNAYVITTIKPRVPQKNQGYKSGPKAKSWVFFVPISDIKNTTRAISNKAKNNFIIFLLQGIYIFGIFDNQTKRDV